MVRRPWRPKSPFEFGDELLDGRDARLQRRRRCCGFLSPAMKRNLPSALTGGRTDRRVIQHPVCPALDVVRTVCLRN